MIHIFLIIPRNKYLYQRDEIVCSDLVAINKSIISIYFTLTSNLVLSNRVFGILFHLNGMWGRIRDNMLQRFYLPRR